MSRPPFLAGIGGPSGSGKTYLAECLARRLGGIVLSLDHYYLDLSGLTLEERARCNFDDPASLDWELAVRHVAALKQGQAVERPSYEFATHTRRRETARVEPGPAVVIDGIFALCHPEMRALYDRKIFVELEDAACFLRRLERDTRERGRTRDSVARQYQQTVRPMCAKFVLPTRKYADVVVRGDQDLEASLRKILAAGACVAPRA